ncbi:MAG: SDR family oxidoreductase [Pseudomonadota bacterium]
MKGLSGKNAIVTGGAKGIGRAVAARFVEEGMRVMIADMDTAEGEKTAAELGDEDTVRFIECDVAERLDNRNLVAATEDAFGAIDILVNNAGILGQGDFLTLKEEDFDRVLRVNLKGAFLLSQTVAKHMVERVEAGEAPGAIVNMSSVNAVFALPNQIPYSVSKAALSQLTKVAALGLAPYGIRVNAVGPGSINTQMLAAVARDPSARQMVMSRTPMGSIGEPEEIAAIVAFLASEEASYMTGQTVFADGGRLPLNYVVKTS